MKEKYPDNFRLDFAVSREQTNEKGEKMYIQTRMAQYAEELWELLKKDSTYVYMCGLKGMEKGIDDIMVSLAAKDGKCIVNHTLIREYKLFQKHRYVSRPHVYDWCISNFRSNPLIFIGFCKFVYAPAVSSSFAT